MRRKSEGALKRIVVRSQMINPVPLCGQCLARFSAFPAPQKKGLSLFGCRRCHEVTHRIDGVERVVLVLDRRDTGRSETTAMTNGVLAVHWFAEPRVVDLDELVIGQIRPRDVEAFIIDWAEEADDYQRRLLKSRRMTLLPEAQLDTNDLRLLAERFASVRHS